MEHSATTLAELKIRIERMEAHQRIIELYRRYIRGLNRYDIEMLRSAFWPDAQINYGVSSKLRDDWVIWWQENHARGIAFRAYQICNEMVDLALEVAHVETHLVAFQRISDDASTTVTGGRYIDRVDCRADEWRIAVREYIPEFLFEAKSTFKSTFRSDNWPTSSLGAADKNDLSYLRPLNYRPTEAT